MESKSHIAPGSSEHRERLAPILAQLDAEGYSTFLDVCELVLMLAERTDGMLQWDHPRVTVHIKMKKKVRTDALLLERDASRKAKNLAHQLHKGRRVRG